MKEFSLFKNNYLKIKIPEGQEERAKKDGLIYDEVEERWIITGDEPKRIYLAVPFDKKDSLKGCIRWDSEKMLWYTYKYQKGIIDKYDLVYLNVPYDSKDEAKQLGAIWHSDRKQWYTPICNTELVEKFKM
jgi:hypothetical protein